jgi:RNA polymerase sigma-70 factor (ECF subfamily)
VGCDEGDFGRWVREVGIGVDGLVGNGGDIYLAYACVRQDPSALGFFEREHLQKIGPLAGQMRLTSDELDEVRQLLRLKLLVGPRPKIADYRGHGPLCAWVRACAARQALNFRRANPDVAGRALVLDELLASDHSVEVTAAKLQHYETFSDCLERCFAGLTAREKTLLRMRFLDAMSIDEIGLVFGVHRATVARWLVAIRGNVLNMLCSELSSDLAATGAEVQSLVRLVGSDVMLSFVRILSETP